MTWSQSISINAPRNNTAGWRSRAPIQVANFSQLRGNRSQAAGRGQQIKLHDFGVTGVDMRQAVAHLHVI